MTVDPEIQQQHVAELLPIIESDIFNQQPDAQFWAGSVAVMGCVMMPPLFHAYKQFRANVYIDDMRFLGEEARLSDGTETDECDDRAVHYAVVENMPDQTARVVGAARLILKRAAQDKLPVEELFPEAFVDAPAPRDAIEVSRFISRHPDKDQQHRIALAEVRLMNMFALERTHTAYAIIEDRLDRLFRLWGLPFRDISDYKYIEEYQTQNKAVCFDPQLVLEAFQADMGRVKLSSYYKDAINNLGMGYYDPTLEAAMPLRVA